MKPGRQTTGAATPSRQTAEGFIRKTVPQCFLTVNEKSIRRFKEK
jgi:hypothetical protein